MVQEHNQIITEWLRIHEQEITEGKIRVLAVDECHVQAGEICGYGWGDRQQRREVNVKNYRDSQTYYGALDCLTGEVMLLPAQTANTASTIKFVEYLQAQAPNTKLALIWDGASYHRSEEFREFLAQVNQGEDWQVHCLRFAPYAPAENPIENIWGQLKHSLRQMYQKCCSFTVTKKLFKMLIQYQLFTLPDLSTYGAFSILT